MKRFLLILVLFTLAPTYNDGEAFTFNGYNHSISKIVGDRVIVDSEYGRFFLEEGQCTPFDIYRWCVDSIVYDPVGLFDHKKTVQVEYEIDIDHEKICSGDSCVAYGQTCNASIECANSCVNNVCRPTSTWCGDGVCDDSEVCSADCSVVENISETINETPEVIQQVNETINETVPVEQPEVVVQEPETQEQETPRLTASPAEGETNVVGAGVTIFGGLILILMIFSRKKKRHTAAHDDTYSYRK